MHSPSPNGPAVADTTPSEPAQITPEAAAHVLWFYDEGGMEPSSFKRLLGAPYPGPRSSPPPVKRRRVHGLLLHLASGTAWRICHAAVLWLAAEVIVVAKGGTL